MTYVVRCYFVRFMPIRTSDDRSIKAERTRYGLTDKIVRNVKTTSLWNFVIEKCLSRIFRRINWMHEIIQFKNASSSFLIKNALCIFLQNYFIVKFYEAFYIMRIWFNDGVTVKTITSSFRIIILCSKDFSPTHLQQIHE